MLTAPGLLKVWNVHPGSRGGLGHLHTWQMATVSCQVPRVQDSCPSPHMGSWRV